MFHSVKDSSEASPQTDESCIVPLHIADGAARSSTHSKRRSINGLACQLVHRHKLPAVYFQRVYVTSGGLISYAPNQIDQFRREAGYVDRILRGEKPADLPVQAPTKYELVINLKTARAFCGNVESGIPMNHEL
jgi:ABC transporter substrate binding protein